MHDPTAAPRRSTAAGDVAVVAAGGSLGAIARFAIADTWPVRPGHVPWATLTANLSGALALGLVLTVLVERVEGLRRLRVALTTGVLGGYTTFSTLSVELALLGKDGHVAVALLYATVTIVGGLAAARAGVLLGRAGPSLPRSHP